MQIRLIKKVEHYIFDNKKEFEQFFMKRGGVVPKLVKDWHKGAKDEWVIADDGGVTQILSKGAYTSKTSGETNILIKTAVGTFIIRKLGGRDKMPYFMDTNLSKHPNRNRFNGKFQSRNTTHRTKRLTAADRIFAFKFALGIDVYDIVDEVYNVEDPHRKIRDLFKSEKLMAEIKKNIREIAKIEGYDDQYIFKEFDKLIKKSKDDRVTLETIIQFAKIIGTIEQSSEEFGRRSLGQGGVVGVFGGFPEKAMDQIEDVQIEDEEEKKADG